MQVNYYQVNKCMKLTPDNFTITKLYTRVVGITPNTSNLLYFTARWNKSNEKS